MSKKIDLLKLAAVVLFSVVLGLVLKNLFKGDWFEYAAFVTGVVGVYLVAVEHIWNWPVGLINVAIYGYVFFTSKLYADMSLQVFFFVLGVLGWYTWLRGGIGATELKISRIPAIWWLFIAATWVIGTAIYYPVILYFGGKSPFVDTTLTVGSVIAQILLNVKKLENWILWIVLDVVYIFLYISRDLKSTAVLYALLLVLAIGGLISWLKTYQSELQTAA